MKRLLIETTGDFMLVDYGAGAVEIEAHRPTVVESTNFVQDRISRDQIAVLGEVNADATDAAFIETLANSKDIQMAVDAFLAEFPLEKPVPKKAAKK